ncbi:hypothetical protein FIU94_00945 [Sulfitobacter sp. THAF37]|uniref:hypothetical protein n=1 Tax=Sulfitobacter sp. THAF37 TaxID=2587855 RepID=UPI0012679FB5|nr:hypothetical protein [Sulfitobacter sp. THAF37]QFT57374.1 hypothetical protein FIU94_00945 [Sulfitobacter sp. THAF37]
MNFAETYRHEVLQSRRDRSRRALFWSRILGIVLMLTIGAVLRAEPDLRRALATAGSDAILAMTGRAAAAPAAPLSVPAAPPQTAQDHGVRVATRPRDRVKVNRPANAQPVADATGPAIDPAALANEIGAQLQTMKPRP